MAEPTRPWPRSSAVKKVVPILAVVVIAFGIGIVGTAHGSDNSVEKPKMTLAEMKALGDNPLLPVTWDDAYKAGTVDQYDWGDRCQIGNPKAPFADLQRSRIKVPSVYSPPCVPVWHGTKPWRNKGGQVVTTNGGVTAPGVTADTITVAYYVPAAQDIASQLKAFGVVDGGEAQYQAVKQLVDIFNQTYELYGRKVVLKPFTAAGDGRNPSLARADARKVAEDMHAFASIGGPTQTAAYADELARRGVICMDCGYGSTDSQFAANAPYAWGHLASPDQLLNGILQFGSQSLKASNAVFAGSEEFRNSPRVFGVVHYEQDPPVFGALEKSSSERFSKLGSGAKLIKSYILDLNSLATQARDIIGELKRNGVTTVVFLGDPLMPKFLTEQADAQDYHPEWILTGTVFTDTTVVGRLYDQDQWAHAFGTSSAAARGEPDMGNIWHIYKWWYGHDPEAKKTMAIAGPIVQDFFIGLQGAGPHLTATTFAGGMFNYPPTPAKGAANNPQISWGFHLNPDKPDFSGVDDFTVVWWDSTAHVPDEAGNMGNGAYQYVFGGVRLPLNNPKVPLTPDALKAMGFNSPQDLLFDRGDPNADPPRKSTSQLIVHPAVSDQAPPFPPWPGSPAAKGG